MCVCGLEGGIATLVDCRVERSREAEGEEQEKESKGSGAHLIFMRKQLSMRKLRKC